MVTGWFSQTGDLGGSRMAIFDFNDADALGSVVAVDTSTVSLRVDQVDKLKTIQVNRLAVLRSSRAGQHLIGVVTRITRKLDDAGASADVETETGSQALPENNLVRVTLERLPIGLGHILQRRSSWRIRAA